MIAADELSHRGWAFQKNIKMWLKRAPNTVPLQQNELEERGTFVLFDPKTWKDVTRADLVVRYAELERPPSLPRPSMGQGQQGQGQGQGQNPSN